MDHSYNSQFNSSCQAGFVSLIGSYGRFPQALRAAWLPMINMNIGFISFNISFVVSFVVQSCNRFNTMCLNPVDESFGEILTIRYTLVNAVHRQFINVSD